MASRLFFRHIGFAATLLVGGVVTVPLGAVALGATAGAAAPVRVAARPGTASRAVTVDPAAGTSRTVQYGDFALQVPASWPVVDLAVTPSACVRFDQSAIYLGHPGAAQQCPAKFQGSVDGLLVEPLDGESAAESIPGTVTLTRGETIVLNAEQLASHTARFVYADAGVVITATFAGSPDRVLQMIEGSTGKLAALGESTPGESAPGESAPGESAPASRAPAQSGAAPAAGATTPDVGAPGQSAAPAASAPTPPLSGSVLQGQAIDTCMAPSLSAMTAWGTASPYQGANIYIGGNNVGCRRSANTNLTASWVRSVAQMGWSLIPTYTGYQVPGGDCSSCGALISMDPSVATAQGASDATDAIANAQSLGIGSGNSLFFDLEAYFPGPTTTPAVMAFLTAWTSTLHASGYTSGVYSSLSSGIADMTRALGYPGYVPPDEIWMAAWITSGYSAVRSVWGFKTVPDPLWSQHQRIYQYAGEHTETWGGYALTVDSNVADAVLTSTPRVANTPWGPLTVSPFGSLDSVTPGADTVSVSGWAVDPDTTAPIPVDVTVDGVLKMRMTAGLNRPDVASAVPGYGAAHGYSATITGLTSGSHSVCTYGINVYPNNVVAPSGNVLLGCRTVVLSGNPIGNFESVAQAPGGVQVSGWAFDPDTAAATQVHIYVDGRWGGLGWTSVARGDVASVYPAAGPQSGFSFPVVVPAGQHSVCAFAINVGPGTTNPLLGCRTIVVAGPGPFGNNESVTRSGNTISAKGWVIDPATASAVTVLIVANGVTIASTAAAVSRPDVAAVLPNFGANHGFTFSGTLSGGTQNVCVVWQSTVGAMLQQSACRAM